MNNLTFEANVTANHLLLLPPELPVGTLVRVTVEPLTGDPLASDYQPRTALGRKLIALRRAHFQAGGQSLSWDGIDAEMRERRGGVEDA